MPNQVTNYQCPACTGPLHYDGATGKLVCDYCGSQYTIDEIEELYADKNEAAAEAMAAAEQEIEAEITESGDWDHYEPENWTPAGMKLYSCPSCGAELVCEETSAAGSCPYCGNPTIIPGTFTGMMKPDYVIPFKLQKKDALEALKKHYGGKKLLPKVFTEANHIEEIKGVYVPFWLFDGTIETSNTYTATRTSVVTTHSERITTTRHFEIDLNGSVSFEKVPADASSKMPDDLMDSLEPYDYSEMVPFSNAYLPGFYADKYDVAKDDCRERAKKREFATAGSIFHNAVNDYDTVNVLSSNKRLKDGKISYVLMPVWLLSTRWNGQNFLFAMNGQTGKLVGDLPVDKSKSRTSFLVGFAGAAAVMALTFLLF